MQRSAAEVMSRRAGASASTSNEVESLVRAAAQGDQLAWDRLVERYSGLVWAVTRAHRLSSADAADVVQTTWMRLVEQLDRLRDPARVGSWLATTARHECLRALRHTKRCRPYDEPPEPAGEQPEPSDEILKAERDALVREAFARLSPADQALLRLLVAEPVPSYEEISAALGRPIGSIGPTRARCLARLARETARVGLVADPVHG